MCINNTSHLIYPIKRINNGTLFWGSTKFILGIPKIANFNSAKTFKITNSQTLISANISSFTVIFKVIGQDHNNYTLITIGSKGIGHTALVLTCTAT